MSVYVRETAFETVVVIAEPPVIKAHETSVGDILTLRMRIFLRVEGVDEAKVVHKFAETR